MKDLLKEACDRLRGRRVDDVEIYLTETRQFSAHAKDGKADFVLESKERGLAVRLFQGGKVGFACASDWGFLERTVEIAYNSLSLLAGGASYALPKALPASAGFTAGQETTERSREDKLDRAIILERAARDYDSRIRRVRDAGYEEEERRLLLFNTRGLEAEDRQVRYELSVMAMAEDKGAQEMGWESDQSTSFHRLDPQALGCRVGERAVSQLGGRPIPTGKTPVVLDAVVAASFLGVLAASFLGDQVQKNRSVLRERLGQDIYSPLVSIVDDGTRSGGFATLLFDGEGMPSCKTSVVRQGRLEKFLYDLSSAARENRAGTGNAVRGGFKELPHVGTTNFYVEPGDAKDLLREMGEGFWIRDVIGVHTADPVTGDFSFGASGTWVKSGLPDRPVRGVTVSGNLHDVFRRTKKVGSDLRFFHSYGSPSLLVDQMDVGGT